MFVRSLVAVAGCAVVAAVAAAGPAPAQTTDTPVPGVQPGACTDTARPTSGFTRRAARRASRHNVLRGTASDVGCGLNRVGISVLRKKGKKCRHLTARGRLTSATSCAHRRWLNVKGTSSWSFRLPKRLANGRYIVRTRAVDFSGNVQRAHNKRLRLR